MYSYPSEKPVTSPGNRNPIPPTDRELFLANKETPEKISTVKAAILLPFLQDKRMIESTKDFLSPWIA